MATSNTTRLHSCSASPFAAALLAAVALFAASVRSETTSANDDAIPQGMSFTEQCPSLLKIADDFAHECLQKARFETRYFAPGALSGGFGKSQPVVHGAYFRAVDSGSHFGIGCTLNNDHKIDFVGVYYSTKSGNFAKANTAPLRFIDYDGNVGLTVDGQQVSLLAIRQFATDFIPQRFRILGPKNDPNTVIDPRTGSGPIKNCENAQLLDGGIKAPSGGWFYAFESKDHDNHVIKSCEDIANKTDPGCRSSNYIEFFPSANRQLIYKGSAAFWYIRDGGDLLVKEDVLKGSCGSTRSANNLNIAHEVCDLPH